MTGNSLYDPLGQPIARPPSTRATAGRVVALVLGVLIVGLTAWGWTRLRTRQPSDMTSAIVPIAPMAPPAPPQQSAAAPPPASQTVDHATPPSTAVGDAGVKIITPSGSAPSTGTFIAIPPSNSLPPAPDPRLVEKSKYGILPRRGLDGSRAAVVYARPVGLDTSSLPANAPRIALVVGGMGLKRSLTAAAAQALPPAVTLGFAPYGGDLGLQVQNARDLGHEAILQVPMESFNEPDGSAMPRMLVTSDTARDTADNLHWQMARFAGYAGVANFLGAKFTADADAFAPVLKEIAARGLFYFDDGTAPRSLATSLGAALSLPMVRADVVIDALADPAVIDAGFKKLETVARTRGVAIGVTTGLPTVVDRVAGFAKGLADRGIVLVPVSSLATEPFASASP